MTEEKPDLAPRFEVVSKLVAAGPHARPKEKTTQRHWGRLMVGTEKVWATDTYLFQENVLKAIDVLPGVRVMKDSDGIHYAWWVDDEGQEHEDEVTFRELEEDEDDDDH